MTLPQRRHFRLFLLALLVLPACKTFSESCEGVVKAACGRNQRCGGSKDEYDLCISIGNSQCAQRSLLNASGEGRNGCRHENEAYNFQKADACAAAWEKNACDAGTPSVCECQSCPVGYDFCEVSG